MATTGDAPLNLTKPEAADVVSLPVINTNYDVIHANAASVASTLATHTGQISTLNTAVGSAGAVVKATNVAGGIAKQVPIQSAANSTVFTNAAGVGQVLTGTSTPPYAQFADRIPFRVQSGIILSSSWANGEVTVEFNTPFDTGIVPIITLTPVAVNTSSLTAVSLNTTPTATGFVARGRSYNGTSFVNSAPTTHWVAIQYASNSASS